eukprot:CAMPEP_0176376210 /NCGR_PEP_ID=MMETSP0126-20121128/28026_1 /TAXON_ID=141414 ORGANISM="Strombidinopsis acuminatum, Strain SPMC142" /NCGR_SAMPLE_ID=MMETSP0126 /ASSEMBLY_ACC=CAM_ASM_000229 /LENGTH=208 /DNA_ID=CAMNT_0017737551 /DNA_START=198 /DNA_END=825 /DNA_ORIENTATION=+
MSSYECGKDIYYSFCDLDGACDGEDGISGAGHIRSSEAGNNNGANRLKMWKYDPEKQGAVTTFQYSSCRGESGRFFGPTDSSTASYTWDMMETRHADNNSISSIMVPQGYTARLWQHDGFSGSHWDIAGPNWSNNNNYFNLAKVCPLDQIIQLPLFKSSETAVLNLLLVSGSPSTQPPRALRFKSKKALPPLKVRLIPNLSPIHLDMK